MSIVVGLLTGVAAAALILGGVLILAPESVPGVSASPSRPALASTAPSPTSPGTSGPSGSPGASAPASPSDDPGALFGVGRPAPPLVVPQVGGGEIDLTNLRGKAVWVNFMGTYCPPCVDEFPLMNGFAARYADDGLVVLAIDVEEEEGVVAAFAQSLGTTFPLGLDLDGSAAVEWRAAALPVHFWVDTDGVIRDGALGGIGPDIMAEGVASILPGVEVTP
jgi:thiol-disulfide isomerase/thioredoxin